MTRPYTVIIPSCTRANVEACAQSIVQAHARPDTVFNESPHIAIVANGPLLSNWHQFSSPAQIIFWNRPFNFSACINYGADEANAWAHGYGMPQFHGKPDVDLLFLNDDTRLLTPNGFDLLREAAHAHPECGLMFPGVTGCTGNPEQIAQPGGGVRYAKRHVVPFIGVYIRREIWNEIGPMDERYCLDYGVEDNDYCYRVTQAGYKLGIFDGCVLEHGVLPSSYRSSGPKSFRQNAALFEQKHGVSVFALP